MIQSSHGLTGANSYFDARPHMAPIGLNGEEFSGWVDLTATNFELGTFHVVGNRQLAQFFLAPQQVDTQTTGENVVSNGATDGVSKVYVAFNNFINTVTIVPTVEQLLPVARAGDAARVGRVNRGG